MSLLSRFTSAPVVFSPQTLKQEWLVTLSIVAIFLLAEFVGVTSPVRSAVAWAIVPFNLRVTQVLKATTTPFIYFESLSTAQRRIQDLERNYAASSAQLSEMDGLKAENLAMKEMLAAGQLSSEQRVLSVPIVAYGRPLIVGGTEQGLENGNMVLVSQTLVGLVTEVSSHQSEVGLLSQENGPTILAKTESDIQALVRGDGKRVILTEVPVSLELKVGERVMTQGQEGVAPNMFIGRVAAIKKEPSAAVQSATLEQLVSFYEASIVEVR